MSFQLNGGQEQQEAAGVPQAIPAASLGFQTLMMVNTSPIAVGDNAGTSVIDLGDLDGTDGFSIEGVASDDYSGGSVSSAGDVNGDGFDDLIIGATGVDENGSGAGAAYIVFGKASGFGANLGLAGLDGTNGFRLEGVAAGDWAGMSVSGAGDVNGDGFDDVIVGGYHADPNGVDSGSSYVVFGKAGGFAASTNLSTLDGTNGFRLDGVAASDLAGGVSNVGDVNGDGFDDVIIGARYADHGGSNSGSAYIVFGKAGGFSATMDLSTLNGTNGFRLDGEASKDAIGTSLLNAGVGDINGDGFDDVIVGAFGADINDSNSGSAYVVFG
ncbi:integrin alpha [Parvibaculaceae bacterium PLY_AMNH_Bact1]|nr:integrin alpha [Parvibaculaceae bacterium PLY_AMNH_Bact1]